eukprot:COSAG04_NODE_2225_length_4496_cov_1.846941_3_plen_313_part_00
MLWRAEDWASAACTAAPMREGRHYVEMTLLQGAETLLGLVALPAAEALTAEVKALDDAGGGGGAQKAEEGLALQHWLCTRTGWLHSGKGPPSDSEMRGGRDWGGRPEMRAEEGDVIGLEVDLEGGSLAVSRNGQHLGLALGAGRVATAAQVGGVVLRGADFVGGGQRDGDGQAAEAARRGNRLPGVRAPRICQIYQMKTAHAVVVDHTLTDQSSQIRAHRSELTDQSFGSFGDLSSASVSSLRRMSRQSCCARQPSVLFSLSLENSVASAPSPLSSGCRPRWSAYPWFASRSADGTGLCTLSAPMLNLRQLR